MKTTNSTTQRWWLMIARGTLYILIGATMFVFATTFSVQAGQLIGTLALIAGGCQLVFSLANQPGEKTKIWGILHGITDVSFGIAIIAFSKGTIDDFTDVLAFWALMYAFLQAVQAMYSFLAARSMKVASGLSSSSFVHFANVLVAGGLTYTLLFLSRGVDSSLGLIGVFPIILGILIILLTGQMRVQATAAL